MAAKKSCKNAKKNKIKTVASDLPKKINLSGYKNEEINYPIFCFKYLQNTSLKECESEVYKNFVERIRKLSDLGWKEIDKSARHSFGTEKIPISMIKPQLPSFVTPEVESLVCFRYTGNNLPFLGLRFNNVFHVIYIESKFGDIYDHE